MIWTAAALHRLPITLLDLVICVFLLNLLPALRHRVDGTRTERSTRGLIGWFGALAVLNGCHVVSCLLVDARASFWVNYGLESTAALASTVPLIGFAYDFADEGEGDGRARRRSLVVTSAIVVGLSSCFLGCAAFAEAPLYYRVAAEHVGLIERPPMLAPALAVVMFGAYLHAALVLVRRGVRARGARRVSVLSFAAVVSAAAAAVVINRLEGYDRLPTGSEAAWTLVVMLGAVVVFMGHDQELTRFSERIVGITLTLVLLVLTFAGEIAVRMRGDEEDRVRAAHLAHAETLWRDGHHDDALAVSGADAVFVGGVASDEAGASIDVVTVDESVVVDGVTLRFRYPYVRRARAVEVVVVRVAAAMLILTLICVLMLHRLFERGVLAPLRKLERAAAAGRAKSLFIAQLSHELRTPLSAVVGHARSLAQTVSSDDQRRARSIGDAAEHLLALVEGLIEEGRADLSHLVARVEPVAIELLVRAVVDLARPRGEPGVDWHVVVDADVPAMIDSDSRLLRQVLLNLLTNAAKNTPRGSITCQVSRVGDVVRVSVSDTGVGIPAVHLERIFDAFHQVDGGDGAGLGLAIVQRMAEALGSHVSVDSVVARGARFWFDLAAPVDARPAAPPSTARLAVPRGSDRAELRELALVGDVIAIDDCARALAARDARYGPFAAEVARLAARCETHALQALLEDGDDDEADEFAVAEAGT